MKPHPSIFRAALDSMARRAGEAVMVGDSLAHDVRAQAGRHARCAARAGAHRAGVDDGRRQ